MLWPVFVLLVAAVMFVLLQACGLVLPGYGSWHRIGFAYCQDRRPTAMTDAERLRLLRDMAYRLQVQLLQQRATCLAQLPPPTRPTQVTEGGKPGGPAPGGQGPAVAGREPPKPPARPPSRPDADFPQEKWDNKDLSLLKGCWQLGREIRRPASAREKNPDICLVIKAVKLCLDEAASGKAEARGEECAQSGPTSCEAPLTAAYAGDGTLRMTTKPASCPDNGHWPKTVFTCRRADDKTLKCDDPSGGAELEFRR